MQDKPEVLASRQIYSGKVFDVLEAEIRQGDVEYKREIVTHHGSCVIVPVFADGTLALVRQYRHAAGKFLLEIPAGTLNENEPPEAGAARELEEEIGVTAERIEKLTEFYVSPGFLTEKMHLYMATGLAETAQRLEEDEILEIERYGFDEAFRLIRDGEIEDAKTIIGLIMAGARFGFIFEPLS
ncbi:MAG: NUDIX hydrolase [Pyrinomonadaceae bacterium]